MNNKQILKDKYLFLDCRTTKIAVCVVDLLWSHMNSYNVTRYLLLKIEKMKTAKLWVKYFTSIRKGI